MKTITTIAGLSTVDVTAKQWHDKVNGNSYFSARVVVNYGMPTERTIALPFQYGYGDHYEDVAVQALQAAGFIPSDEYLRLWHLKDMGIIVRSQKHEGCKKKDVLTYVVDVYKQPGVLVDVKGHATVYVTDARKEQEATTNG